MLYFTFSSHLNNDPISKIDTNDITRNYNSDNMQRFFKIQGKENKLKGSLKREPINIERTKDQHEIKSKVKRILDRL